MQQFTVPQFIDVEDKIIGPITARQFIIMLAGGLLIAICYKLFDFTLFLSLGIMIFCVCGVLAFFKVNGMPFHFFILNFLETLGRPGLRVWNNLATGFTASREADEIIRPPTPVQPIKVYAASRLAELALIVDTRGAYRGEAEEENSPADFSGSAGKAAK
jgi:hypothetical protein